MTTVAEPSQPAIRSVSAHPRIRAHAERMLVLSAELERTRAREAAITAERDGLAEGSVAVLVTLGRVTQGELDARAEQLTSDLEHVRADVARLEREHGQMVIDAKALHAEIQCDLRSQAEAEVREIVRSLGPHLRAFELAARSLTELHRAGVSVPAVVVLAGTEIAAKLRVEAVRRFGVALD